MHEYHIGSFKRKHLYRLQCIVYNWLALHIHKFLKHLLLCIAKKVGICQLPPPYYSSPPAIPWWQGCQYTWGWPYRYISAQAQCTLCLCLRLSHSRTHLSHHKFDTTPLPFALTSLRIFVLLIGREFLSCSEIENTLCWLRPFKESARKKQAASQSSQQLRGSSANVLRAFGAHGFGHMHEVERGAPIFSVEVVGGTPWIRDANVKAVDHVDARAGLLRLVVALELEVRK